ncbi:AlpA family phage regulatory protein [Aliarcobacter butzleri]|uniref:helix-turn-helix transcriptional regulator n=1 Tax=Aliarcobacter butzleri TaxID=28197 RepID=UPI001EDC7EF3|nr:AlpA family phage regulatory protein [Aliarcobacter butzleri]MCG3667479.1 AlpA family phage regulatory protein [Aliarcobacter butzleri]
MVLNKDQEQLLKIKDIQKILPICTSKIYSLIAKNKFPKPIKIGRSSFWQLKTINDYMKEQENLNQVKGEI